MGIMTENFKILTEFVKDISSETPDVQTYIFVKDTISKYHLDINIASKPLKNKLIEVNTTLKFEDKELNQKKSHFEIISGAALAFAAFLLILPGFATDTLGLLIIFPPTRRFFLRKISTKYSSNNKKKQDFINGEFEDIDEDNDRKL